MDVHNFLLERDVPHELVSTRGRLRSPKRMASVLGLPVEQVGTVTLLEGGGLLAATLVSSDAELDRKRLAAALGVASMRRVPQHRVADLTGFLPEALPPVALPAETRVAADTVLAKQEVLYFAGGESSTMLKIRGSDLVRATDATVIDLAK